LKIQQPSEAVMPRDYPAEFRARAIALVRAGKEQKQTAVDLGIRWREAAPVGEAHFSTVLHRLNQR
jgi:transposase-like protein